MSSFVVFAFLSIILLKLSYEDLKTKLVDAPTSLYASGFVTAAFILSERFMEFIAWAIIFMIAWKFLKPFTEKNNLLGAGDISILSFLLPAAWFVNAWSLSVFLIFFGLTTLILYRKKLFNKSDKPLVPVILIAWTLTWITTQTFLGGI